MVQAVPGFESSLNRRLRYMIYMCTLIIILLAARLAANEIGLAEKCK